MQLRSQVLLSCVRCPMGELLTNGNVIDIFQACFRIGHYQTEKSKGMTGMNAPPRRPLILRRPACQGSTSFHSEYNLGISACLYLPM